MAEERGRAARFFEGFANALLERALPRVREWLQGRFGPGAEVGAIRLEGRDVHVDDTRVPLGPRASLSIARATFHITGETSRPLTLHALNGEVRVDEGGFVAPVRFASSSQVRPEAWIEGALRIENATWPRVDAAGEQAPLDGSLEVVVTSGRWTLERGAFTCADARIAIEAEGDLDASGAKRLGRARIDIRDARAAHFADAARAIAGARMSGALTLLKAARVEGALLWNATDGLDADVSARTERSALRVRARAALDESVNGTIEGDVGVAEVLAAFDVPEAARPAVEDIARCDAKIGGTTRAPRTFGALHADVLRMRIGAEAKNARIDFDVDAKHATARGSAAIDDGAVRFDASIPLGEGERVVKIEVERVPMKWASERLPPDTRVSGTLGLDGGEVVVSTARSRLSFEPLRFGGGRFDGTRVRGDVATSELTTRVDELLRVDGAVVGLLREPMFEGTCRVRDVELDVSASSERIRVRFADAPPLLAELACTLLGTNVQIPSDSALTGEIAIVPRGPIDADLGVETPSSALVAKVLVAPDGALRGSTIRGRLSFGDAIAIGVFRSSIRPRPNGAMQLKGVLEGSTLQPVLHVDAEAPALDLEVPALEPLPFRDVSARLTVDRARLVIRSLVARVNHGEAACEALVGWTPAFDGMQFRIRCGGVRVDELALRTGRTFNAWLSGRLSATVTLDRRGDGPLIGNGDLRVDTPIYLAMALLAPTMSRHGLAMPSNVGVSPLVARFGFGERGIRFDGIDARVDSVTVSGWTAVDWDRAVSGRVDAHLDPRVVRNHALLGIPAMFARSIPISVDLSGTIDEPRTRIDALRSLGVAETLDSVTSAFADLFAIPRREPVTPADPEIDAILDRILDHDPRSEQLIAQLVDRGVDPDEFERLLARRRAARRR